jgi:DNA-binding SARP family transcriptional activator/tetratricopeptide (TPR) repeat protein
VGTGRPDARQHAGRLTNVILPGYFSVTLPVTATPPAIDRGMIRLKSFGTIDLRGPTGELRGVLSQPKRLALLLRLAAERPGTFLRRDALLAMFWPELDATGARNALRQALFHLRRELGEGVLLSRGDEEVGLDAGRLSSDVGEFEEAAATARWRVALDLLRGELAPGLYVADAAGFEEWLETRRADIRRRAAAGAWTLCREAESAGAPALAAGWARRALEHDPDDEKGLRRLLTLLIRSGDAAGAAQAYAAFEERMRREYGVAPSPETVALRRSIPSESPSAPTAAPPAAAVPARAPDPPAPAPAPAPASPPPVPASPSRLGVRVRWAVAMALVLAVAAAVGRWRAIAAVHDNISPGRLLIAPFRTTSQDSVLTALAVGLVDLTSARLSGASLPHPVDPDVALRAVAEARTADSAPESERLRRAAGRTGAGLVLSGTLLFQQGRLVLAPVVMETGSGRVTPLPQVSGSIDSLPWMVDRMAASLLSTIAGESSADAPALAAIPLPALRAYLDGREAMRNGRVTDAMASLARALELDSTFALAARDYAEAADWAGEDPVASAKHRAWSLRDRLGIRDRAILVALVGRRFPQLTPVREQVEDWEAAIRWAPDRSRTWFGLGDVLFHVGDVAGVAGAQDRARNAFDRALTLDSASVPTLLHRVEMAAREGDTAVVRRLMPRTERSEAPSDAKEFLRWRAAVALGDSATLRRLHASLDSLSSFALVRIIGWGQLDGLGMAVPARALVILQRQTRTSSEAGHVFTMAVAFAGNRGEHAAMDQVLLAGGVGSLLPAALAYASDDAARPEFEAMDRAVSTGADTSWAAREEVLFWRLWRGEPVSPSDARRHLAALDQHAGDLGSEAYACLTAARIAEPAARSRLRRADSLASQVTSAGDIGTSFLVLARCHEAMGDRRGALALLARRPLDAVYGPRYLAGYLYDEGRLALAEGDRARALRAWRQFLVLRDDPDPALRPQVAAVRRTVDSLGRD